jgi:hypothetical protein
MLEYRMYGLVPYNISPIQQGIQFGHAVVEYSLINGSDKDYIQWSTKDKTFIILNGGTTNKSVVNGDVVGTLNQHKNKLREYGVKVASFYEPDLGDQLTAVVFLVDERYYDFKKYPDFKVNYNQLEPFNPEDYVSKENQYKFWEESMSRLVGDVKKFIEIRDYLKSFKFA